MTPLEIQAANAQIKMSREVSNILDNLKDSIDWEQRRYEIAKDVYTVLLGQSNELTYMQKAENAVRRADALIEALKKKA